MKGLTAFCFCCLLAGCGENNSSGASGPQSAQGDTVPVKISPQEIHQSLNDVKDPVLIARSLAKVLQTDKLVILDSVELQNEEFLENQPDGGGSLTGYFHKGALIRLTEWIGLSYGVRQRDFYFDTLKLYYVLEQESYFAISDSLGTDPSRFENSYRGDHFFRNDSLIEQTSSGEKRFKAERPDGIEFIEAATEYKNLLVKNRRAKR